MPEKVIIIGAGIGGLATANLLAQKGYEVHLYEASNQAGGRAGKKIENGFTFDTGPSWYLMPQVFKDYFSLFDIDVDQALSIQRLSPAYKVFFESHTPITIRGDLDEDAQSFEHVETGAGDALRDYVAKGTEIYRLALQHFLYTDFSHPTQLLKKEIMTSAPRLFSLLTKPIHQYVSQFVQTPELQKILEYPMVFLGTSPFKAPAMYSLMSALDFNEGVFYPQRGMYSIIELLFSIGQKQGVTYHFSQEVKQIIHADFLANGVVLADGTSVAADIVISNADLHHTETNLLDESARSYSETYWDKKQSGISALLVYLGVRGSLPQLEHHNLYFVDDWKENFTSIYESKKLPTSASLYVSRTSATDPSTALNDHENLFMLVPLPTGMYPDADEQTRLATHFLEQFAQAIDQPDLTERIVSQSIFGPKDFTETFHAWEGTALGMSHVLGQSALWRTSPQSKKLKNLFYVGASTMPGIGLPMCLISAEIVYKKIVGDHSTGPLAHNKEHK